MLSTNMLTTNEISNIATSVGQALGGFVSEIVSGFLIVAIPVFIQLWRKVRLKQRIISALVRGIEKSSEDIGAGDTVFVKKAVQQEAADANITQHVNQAVKEETKKMAEEKQTNGVDGGHI